MIIGLHGPAGVGKTTIAQLLVEKYGFTRVSIGSPIKKMISALGVSTKDLLENKERECYLLDDHTPRYALQTLGYDWGIKCMGDSFWANIAAREIASVEGGVVVDDVRFPNDARMISNLNGTVIRLCRDSFLPSNHVSEVCLPLGLLDYSSTNLDAEICAEEVYSLAQTDDRIKQSQEMFFSSGSSGCMFAKKLAETKESKGWVKKVFLSIDDIRPVNDFVVESEKSEDVQLVSLIFPNITSYTELATLIENMLKMDLFSFEIIHEDEERICLHLYRKIGGKNSWVGGFCNFYLSPETRKSPFVELAVRVKARPNYTKSIQPVPPDGQIHIADHDIPELDKATFEKLWKESFKQTKEVLGHHPDVFSKAETTFVMPKEYLNQLQLCR